MVVRVTTSSGSEYRFFQSKGCLRLIRRNVFDIRVRHFELGVKNEMIIRGTNFAYDDGNDYVFTSSPISSIEIVDGNGETGLQVVLTNQSGSKGRFWQCEGQLRFSYGPHDIHVKEITIGENEITIGGYWFDTFGRETAFYNPVIIHKNELASVTIAEVYQKPSFFRRLLVTIADFFS